MVASIVVASSLNNCIGLNNKLPWSLPKDLKHFKDVTTSGSRNIVIMGRNTFESIGKPLSGRINCVLSKKLNKKNNFLIETFDSLEEVIKEILWWENFLSIEYNVFFIGGASLFKEVIEKGIVNKIFHTQIHENIEGDTFFEVPKWRVIEEESYAPDEKNKYAMTFRTLERV